MATIAPPVRPVDDPAGTPVPPGRLTEEQFLAWCPEDARAEWVDGDVIIMSPCSYHHVNIVGFLGALLREFAERRELGVVLGPEFAVRLTGPDRRRVPDLLFVARDRTGLLRPTHLEGPPDLAVEVVSPDSVARDWREKFLDYQAAGVREYWIVDPLSQRVELNVLEESAYRQVEPREGRLDSRALPGFFLRPDWLWQDPLPKLRAVAAELGLAG